jgi:hypothetical protein
MITNILQSTWCEKYIREMNPHELTPLIPLSAPQRGGM